MSFRTLSLNASAHVTRVLVSTIIALIIPGVLVRVLPIETYSVWVLILQLTTYVNLLDFSLQIAVGRFVAHATEMHDDEYRDSIISTALSFLIGSTLIGFLLVFILVRVLPLLFPDIPPSFLYDARLVLIIVGLSLTIGLPACVANGIFIGLQRSEVPMSILVGGKILSSLLIIIIAYHGANLVIMAVALSTTNLLTSLTQVIACRYLVPGIHPRRCLITRLIVRELGSYCLSLTVWSMASLLISGLDIVIVGYFTFDAVSYYGLAITITSFILQIQGAVFSSIIPAGATLCARGENHRLGELLVIMTRYGTLLLLAMGLPIIFGANLLLNLWVGPQYADQTRPILQVLVLANMVRLLGLPYANLVVATNQQHLVILSPLAEGCTNFVVSVASIMVFGAIGAAIGTLVGAFVSIGFHLVYNLPRTKLISVERKLVITEGLLRPLTCALPALLTALVVPKNFISSPINQVFIVGITILVTLFIIWLFGLMPDERRRIICIFQRS